MDGGVLRYVLLTDICGSSKLSETFPREYLHLLGQHNLALQTAITSHGGELAKNLGDGYMALFNSPQDAVATAIEAQQAVAALPALPHGKSLRIRTVIHCGELTRVDEGADYHGTCLNRASRIERMCHGGQILVSSNVRSAMWEPVNDWSLRPLGIYRLRDLDTPEALYQLVHPELPDNFPPLVRFSLTARAIAALVSLAVVMFLLALVVAAVTLSKPQTALSAKPGTFDQLEERNRQLEIEKARLEQEIGRMRRLAPGAPPSQE